MITQDDINQLKRQITFEIIRERKRSQEQIDDVSAAVKLLLNLFDSRPETMLLRTSALSEREFHNREYILFLLEGVASVGRLDQPDIEV